jgi:DNA-binding Lrp family transcriptional regulator
MSTFGKYPVWVQAKLRGNFSAIATLVELVVLMDHNTYRTTVSSARLAERLGCSTSTVKRSLATLLDEGVISRHYGYRKTGVYKVNMEDPMAIDDWDELETLGEDNNQKESPKKTSGGRLNRLVQYFRTEVEMMTPMSIQSQVNGKALSKHFKEMLDTHGLSEYDIKRMITVFAGELEGTGTSDVPAWKAFLANRQALLNKVNRGNIDVVFIDDGRPEGV